MNIMGLKIGRIKMMNKESSSQQLMKWMILFSLIIEVIGILLVDHKMSFSLGLLFGLIFSLLKLKLMENTIKKSITMSEGEAQKYMNRNYFLRYILTGIVLVIGALEPTIDLLALFLGLMSMKAAAYMQLLVNKKH